MRLRDAKDLFWGLTKEFYDTASVIWGRQSRIAKPTVPLVSITTKNVKRQSFPHVSVVDGVLVSSFQVQMSLTVDLFTHGKEIKDGETILAYEDTALNDMMNYASFLGSHYVLNWCHNNNITILVEGDAQDMTRLVNDDNYEYRSQLNISLYYTEYAVGETNSLLEDSILYKKVVDNEVKYLPGEPRDEFSETGSGTQKYKDPQDEKIDPQFEKDSSEGGTQKLADEITGYFTEAEIKEEEFDNG